MLQTDDADLLAQLFGLSGEARLQGPVDRGEQGQVWRLAVQDSRYAVKETLAPLEDEQAELAHAFQLSAEAAGVRAPEAVSARDGGVVVRLGAEALRLYRWVEMEAPDRGVSPEELGRCLARLHRVGRPLTSRTHPWYFEPVGRERWEV